MSVLVWIEQKENDAVASCWEVVGKGRELADALGTARRGGRRASRTLYAALTGRMAA